jgi:hypothetical protein
MKNIKEKIEIFTKALQIHNGNMSETVCWLNSPHGFLSGLTPAGMTEENPETVIHLLDIIMCIGIT